MNTYPIGARVRVPFGAGKYQLAIVEGYTRKGDAKVRAYNRTQGKWMPNTRTIPVDRLRPEYVGEAGK